MTWLDATRRVVRRSAVLGLAIAGLGLASSPLVELTGQGARAQTAGPQQAPGAAALLSQGDWCGDYRPRMPDRVRLAERNGDRLLAAQAELAPGFEAGRAQSGLMLLGNYQAELEKRQPDRLLAATYLAMTATVSVTEAMVERINGLLCVTASRQLVADVASNAEAQRRSLASR